MTKVRSKKKVIKEAQKEGKTVHCATLVDMPRQELGVGTEIPKVFKDVLYSGCDIATDDSGSYAVFTGFVSITNDGSNRYGMS